MKCSVDSSLSLPLRIRCSTWYCASRSWRTLPMPAPTHPRKYWVKKIDLLLTDWWDRVLQALQQYSVGSDTHLHTYLDVHASLMPLLVHLTRVITVKKKGLSWKTHRSAKRTAHVITSALSCCYRRKERKGQIVFTFCSQLSLKSSTKYW